MVLTFYLKGHVGDVDQLVVCEREQVEEAQLGESSRLDLLHSVPIDHELFQRGQAIKGLLGFSGILFRFISCVVLKRSNAVVCA